LTKGERNEETVHGRTDHQSPPPREFQKMDESLFSGSLLLTLAPKIGELEASQQAA